MMEEPTKRVYEINALPIVNIYAECGSQSFNQDLRSRKSYVSPYAKFDKMRRKRR